jgi:hypothetical protein
MWSGLLMGDQGAFVATLTNGSSGLFRGYSGSASASPPYFGTLAPDVMRGRTIVRLWDDYSTNALGVAQITIGGFPASPALAQEWLVSVKIGAVTRTGASASLFISGGALPATAYSWQWNSQPWGLATSGNTPVVIVTS